MPFKFLWILSLCLSVAASPVGVTPEATDTYRIFLLKRQADGFAIESIDLDPSDGGSRTFECNAETGIVDIIMPVGPGGAGGIASSAAGKQLTVLFGNGEMKVKELGPDGSGWTRPTRAVADLERYDVRVSVTGNDGQAQAFLITQNKTVAADPVGLVVDLFAGKVPLGQGDCALYSETYRHDRGVPVLGSTDLRIERWPLVNVTLADGRSGLFLVDIGAGSTLVADDFLPEGQVIEEALVMSYSAAGAKKLKYTPEGATGAVQTILGKTELPLLAMEGLVFENVSVDVMKGLSGILGRPLAGILGLDLIARTPVLSLALGGERPSMSLCNKSAATDGEFIELPLAMIRSHIVVDGLVGETKVSFILDTGAPQPFLDVLAATSTGVAIDASSGVEGGGLDGGKVSILDSQPSALTFGSHTFEDVAFKVSALPAFSTLRGGGQCVGLLGVSFFARLERVDIDFESRVVRFYLPAQEG